jgi:hypothetical protein
MEHEVSRRTFLGSVAAGLGSATGFTGLTLPSVASELERKQHQILLIWLEGGVSQLEEWDPKPKTETGGPFRDIETTVPGVRISELLPQTAQQMHRLALVRGINSHENDHQRGRYLVHTGRARQPGVIYPTLGAVASKFLAPDTSPLPGYIQIRPGGYGVDRTTAAFLGAKHNALFLGNGEPPANMVRAAAVEARDSPRQTLRTRANDHFARRRRTAKTEAYPATYEQALQLLERREIFDVSREPARDQERYGRHDFGRHCFLARRLLEAGVAFVQVTHMDYDTHNENFDAHLEQVGEFDGPFAALVEDLAQRGRLAHTLVVVMSEFGRTPIINMNYGRDHWGTAWSIALGGAGIKPGMVFGKTNAKGTEVVEGQVNAGDLFHTYLSAVGLDPTDSYEAEGRAIQIADPSCRSIKDVLV